MNNEQRENLEELKLAEETLRVLDGERCETDQDSRTLELGRLLKQSASHEMPESNCELREMLLAELDGESTASSTTLAPKPISVDRVGRRRMWLGMPAAALLIAAGGWWLYSIGSKNVAYQNYSNDVDRSVLTARAEAAERQVNSSRRGMGGEGLLSERISRGSKGARGAGKQVELGTDSKRFNRDFAVYEQAPNNFQESDQQGEQAGQRSANGESGRYEQLGVAMQADGQQKMQGKGEGQGEGQGQGLGQGPGQSVQLGVRIELPELETTTRNTVVNVPKDGTIMTGGIKRKRSAVDSTGKSKDGVWRLKKEADSGVAHAGSQRMEPRFGNGEARYRPDPVEYQPQIRGRKALADRYSTFHDFAEADLDDVYHESKTESLFDLESETREQYTPIYENQFVQAAGGAAVSTFSVDVDTASYANMRRFLNSGQRPPRDSVRIEELVNYFQYDYPQPKGDDPFSVNMELASCPWNNTHKLLRVGLKGKEVHVKERPATNVVYLIDVSGSMNSKDKLPLLKRGFQMMTKQLGENDRVSIVTYAGNAGVALEPTTGDKTRTINEAIERLSPGGSTHGSAGIELAYKLAQQHFITGGVNKVILATDGDLNVGVTDDNSLVKLIKQKASEGVFLTVLGFGTGNLQDGKLEKLADNGNGHYAYLDSNREAHRVLVQQLSGSLVTIAKDVKIQIEFNPAEVKSYRLIGYENRMLATKDFDDDRKDAGEIGAGHTVTAIYEIEPTGGVAAAFMAPPGMKYQVPGAEVPQEGEIEKSPNLSDAASSGELATVALRYKKPDENKSKRIEFAIKNDDKSFTSASDDFRFATSVAGFGMLLRGSEHAGISTPAMIFDMANGSTGDDTSGYRAEFLDLVRKFVPKDHVLGSALEATFKRGETVTIALGGFFDLDGDGVSDLEKLKKMIARNGGRVVASHDADGNVTGKIDSSTRFFVLGPTPRDGSKKIFDAMASMKEQAESNSVEIIELRKLLNWMGIDSSEKIERLDSRIGESTGFKSRSPE